MDLPFYHALGTEPVPGPQPEGSDVRYEEDFADLQAEIDKLTALNVQEPINWNRVRSFAERILQKQSKDLLVASYLGVALNHCQGLQGFRAGISVLQGFCVTFWENGFPLLKRMRARMNAISWWQEKTFEWMRELECPPLPREEHEALVAAMDLLEQTLAERLPDMPPMNDILNLVRGLAVEDSDTPEEPATEEGASPSHGAHGGETVFSLVFEDMGQARKALSQTGTAYATFAMEHALEDPLGWLLSRVAVWALVEQLPPAENNRTLLAPPDEAVRSGIETLLATGKYREAAIRADNEAKSFLFWLDLHRFVHTALLNIDGLDGASAALAVKQAAQLFTARFPGVEELCFADGTPFADTETKDWLQGDAGGTVPKNEEHNFLVEARALANGGKTQDALEILAKASRQVTTAPQRVRILCAQTAIITQAGQAGIALPLAEELLAELDRRGLEDWDPELATEALETISQTYSALGEERSADLRSVLARLIRLNPLYFHDL